MKMIYYEPRWQGKLGIGRFSSAVLSRIDGEPLTITGDPSSAIDSAKLSLALRQVPKDSVFFSPGYNAPLFSAVPFVFTVHDLNHIDRPENSSIAKRLYYAAVLKRACHRASRVLTVSEFSRDRIVRWSGLSEDQVINVGNGVDPIFTSAAQPNSPGYPYLLCVGNRKHHKNEFRVLTAFAQSDLPVEMKLIFSGMPSPELAAHIANSMAAERVVFTGLLSEAQLASLYKGATALLFPSLYEGFGLPAIEAMACGTPVITSNTTSLPEVAGGAALLVDPESVGEIATAITRLVHDADLQNDLRTKGYERAKYFTWDRTAAAILDILRSI